MDGCEQRGQTVEGLNFAAARDEGLEQIEYIIDHYERELSLGRSEIRKYLTENITFQIDDDLAKGMQLYFELAAKHNLIETNRPIQFLTF